MQSLCSLLRKGGRNCLIWVVLATSCVLYLLDRWGFAWSTSRLTTKSFEAWSLLIFMSPCVRRARVASCWQNHINARGGFETISYNTEVFRPVELLTAQTADWLYWPGANVCNCVCHSLDTVPQRTVFKPPESIKKRLYVMCILHLGILGLSKGKLWLMILRSCPQ